MDCTHHPIAACRHLLETGVASDGLTTSVLIRYNLMNPKDAIQKEELYQKKLPVLCASILNDLNIKGLLKTAE